MSCIIATRRELRVRTILAQTNRPVPFAQAPLAGAIRSNPGGMAAVGEPGAGGLWLLRRARR